MVRRIALCLMLMFTAAMVTTASPAGADDATIVAYLTGAAEVPPADPDAFGRADITIDDAANQLCLVLQWTAVDPTLSGLHIHEAPSNLNGPIRVPFTTPPNAPTGQFNECVLVADEARLDDIAANPQKYYINLHSTPTYPGGAIRGQLQLGPGDVTAPTCFVSGLFAGPPKQQEVTAQDTGSGLAAIRNVQVVNGTVNVQPFAPGSTAAVKVTATKVDPSQPTMWRFDAVDVAGNVRHCA